MLKIIIGKEISLRALNENDSIKILEWVNKPELKKMTGTVYPISELEHKNWFENKVTHNNEKIFGIELNSEKKLIGIVGLKNINYINSNAELYIYIGDNSYIGKGLGRDSLTTIVKFSFEEMNLHKIYLEVFSYNENAKLLYEKVGFEIEGILKESLFKNGRYYDKILMGIIND